MKSEAVEIVSGAFNFPEQIRESVGRHNHNYQAIALDAVKIYADNYADSEWLKQTTNNQELMDLVTGRLMMMLPSIGIKLVFNR